MKKRFRGFTLIECLIAMAILAVGSLVMAQAYATISMRNKMNHLVNTSLSNQVAYVEKYEKSNSEVVPIKYGGTITAGADPVHKSDSSNKTTVLQIVRKDSDTVDNRYSYPVDVYVLKSRDRDNTAISKTKAEVAAGDAGDTGGYGEDDFNLRYRYIQGHTNSP